MNTKATQELRQPTLDISKDLEENNSSVNLHKSYNGGLVIQLTTEGYSYFGYKTEAVTCIIYQSPFECNIWEHVLLNLNWYTHTHNDFYWGKGIILPVL